MPTHAPVPSHTVASVGYTNARPLIHGLADDPAVRLELDVPARLLPRLAEGRADVALLPTIDYQRLDDALVVPAGGIGCDGPTLTVRLFSRQPLEQTRVLACDTESHTSVALARIIFAELYGSTPEFTELRNAGRNDGEARLLIGDKVVCEEPSGFDHQLDLGAAWKRLTGLPFVFAVWATRRGTDLADLPERLAAAREQGLANLPAIVEKVAVPRGWPAGLAMQYLDSYLKFDIGEPQLRAIRLFHELAHKHGLTRGVRPLELYG